MKHKTSELTGALLDAAVAMAEGYTVQTGVGSSGEGVRMKKVERDGEVAVLVSCVWRYGEPPPEHETLCMDARLVNAALEGDRAGVPNRLRLMEEVRTMFPQRDDLVEWSRYAVVRWVPKGLVFRIQENGEFCEIHPFNPREYLVA